MISIHISADAKDTQAFLARVSGKIENPQALNDALGRRLERELRSHFSDRNAEPNKMAADKTNFWAGVREATVLTDVTAAGATVSIGADSHFRIHLLGGVIKPGPGKKWLTIPLIPEARGLRAAAYEAASGRKLFCIGGRRPKHVLFERSDAGGEKFLPRDTRGTIRGKAGYRKVGIGGGSKLRAVYALAAQANIKKDPRALPPREALAAALQETCNEWAATFNGKGNP